MTWFFCLLPFVFTFLLFVASGLLTLITRLTFLLSLFLFRSLYFFFFVYSHFSILRHFNCISTDFRFRRAATITAYSR